MDLIKTALDSYENAQLPVSGDKGFGFAAEGDKKKACFSCTAWGSEVRSFVGLVGTPRDKMMLLSYVALRTVMLGWVTGSFLHRLASCFVHPWSHRKELSAYFHRLYKFRREIGD